MVRLVFRPYTQLRRSICTSESLRSSIRVSPDFNLARHSSPSFGSEQTHSGFSARSEVEAKSRDCAPPTREGDRPSAAKTAFAFTAPLGLGRPNDSCVCSTPWSVFQDGSEVPPTYSRQRWGPCQQKRHSLYEPPPLPTAPGASNAGLAELGRKLHPRPRSRQQWFVASEDGERNAAVAHPRFGHRGSSLIPPARERDGGGLNLSPQNFENTSVYHYTVSRTLELSLQSSFQLSLTVLVCYRSWGHI